MSFTMHIVDAADVGEWDGCYICGRFENKDKVGLVLHPNVPATKAPSGSKSVNVKSFAEAEEYMSKLGKKKAAPKKAKKKDD